MRIQRTLKYYVYYNYLYLDHENRQRHGYMLERTLNSLSEAQHYVEHKHHRLDTNKEWYSIETKQFPLNPVAHDKEI